MGHQPEPDVFEAGSQMLLIRHKRTQGLMTLG
jgi:hypothetical protein